MLFTGLPGAGKGTFGADLCVRYLRAGFTVYSNMFIRDNFTGRTARPCLTWLDVLTASVCGLETEEPTIIYLAEIQQYCDARRWQATPSWWSGLMQNRRHMGLCLMGDCQSISDVEKRLRMLVGQVLQVRPAPCRGWSESGASWLIPPPVKYLLRRLPIFWLRQVDLELGDDPALYRAPGKWRRRWLLSHAFHGHATWELLPGLDMCDMSEEKVLAEVEALRIRAVACNAVRDLPSYADTRACTLPQAGFERHGEGWTPQDAPV